MGEFSTVVETVDFVSGLHNCLEFSQPLSCLYHTENVFYCLNVTQEYRCFPRLHLRKRCSDTRKTKLSFSLGKGSLRNNNSSRKAFHVFKPLYTHLRLEEQDREFSTAMGLATSSNHTIHRGHHLLEETDSHNAVLE